MAKKLDAFPTGLEPERPTLYPWKEWLDGSVWELHQGTDFKINADSMRTQARVQAAKMGGHVKAQIFDAKRGLILQFVPGPGPGKGVDASKSKKA